MLKIKCPKCKKDAELDSDCSNIKCKDCKHDMDFMEYVDLVAQNDPASSNILADYAENTKGKSEDLDEWD